LNLLRRTTILEFASILNSPQVNMILLEVETALRAQSMLKKPRLTSNTSTFSLKAWPSTSMTLTSKHSSSHRTRSMTRIRLNAWSHQRLWMYVSASSPGRMRTQQLYLKMQQHSNLIKLQSNLAVLPLGTKHFWTTPPRYSTLG
jgi:hypothetical protein